MPARDTALRECGKMPRGSTTKKEGLDMGILAGAVFGFIGWFLVRYLIAGLYTVDQK